MKYDAFFEANVENMIRDVQRLVRIRSVEDIPQAGMPFGEGVEQALKEALAICEESGYQTTNLDGYAGYAETGQGEEVVGILVHLDVVPEGSGWRKDPYGGEVEGGRIYGRGTSDDKGPAIAALYALKAVEASGIALNKRVRIIFGTNEESGCLCIKHYVEREGHVDIGFTPDAAFPLIHGEKMILQLDILIPNEGEQRETYLMDISGGSAVNMVADECRATLHSNEPEKLVGQFDAFIVQHPIKGAYTVSDDEITFQIKGASSHGSRPEEGVNAIAHMIQFLKTVQLGKGAAFTEIFDKLFALEVNGALMGLNLSDKYGQTTLCVGNIQTKEDGIHVGIDLRCPITAEYEDVIRRLDGAVQAVQARYSVLEYKQALFMPPEDKLVVSLMDCYREVTGDDAAQPFTIGGGTYARTMNNILGFGMLFPDEEDRMHKQDESIAIDSLLKAAKIYAAAIERLAAGE